VNEVCSSCGLPIVVPKVWDGIKLPRVKQRIFDLVAKRPGISAEMLRLWVWDDWKGGPESGSNLYVHIVQLNRLLAKKGVGVKIVSREFGYWLQPT
jgi:hypothetical protein